MRGKYIGALRYRADVVQARCYPKAAMLVAPSAWALFAQFAKLLRPMIRMLACLLVKMHRASFAATIICRIGHSSLPSNNDDCAFWAAAFGLIHGIAQIGGYVSVDHERMTILVTQDENLGACHRAHSMTLAKMGFDLNLHTAPPYYAPSALILAKRPAFRHVRRAPDTLSIGAAPVYLGHGVTKECIE